MFLPASGNEFDNHWYTAAMEKLVGVVQELSQTQDLAGVMAIVRSAARELTGADGATFVLRDGDKCYYADEDAITPLWKGQRFPLSACISGWSMLNKKYAAIEDIYTDPRIPVDAYKVTFVKSLLMVPIRQQNPIGSIGNYWAHKHLPTEAEIKILQALADATSVSMRNIELMEELQTTYQRREKKILDKMPDGILAIDPDGLIENCNKAGEDLFGYTPDEMIGQDIRLLLPEGLPIHPNGFPADGSMRQTTVKRKNGQSFPVEITLTYIEAGEASFFSAVFHDISVQRHNEQKLLDAKTQAERATRAKSEFLAVMSHELRTPLNSIIGMTRLLHEGLPADGDHRDMVGIAYQSATRLLSIVNDILDLSKIEAGELKLENTDFSLHETAEGIMQTMLPLSSQKAITLTHNFNDIEKAGYFIGDPLRLSRIMINLVGNAVKYTEKGSVAVETKLRPLAEPDHTWMLEFIVTDTGIGIPSDKIDHIFEQFAQADSSITRRFGGTGLGLHIVKELVEKMNGTIGVESTEGAGSRFWFKIPFVRSEQQPVKIPNTQKDQHPDSLPPEMRKPISEMRLLIAEDHTLNQQYMHYLLRRMGATHYDMVENGKEALKKMEQSNYDLILMDCHMPELSGYDTTRHIRLIEKNTGKHIPIVAMTADAMIGTRENCLDAGMDDYITKPLNPDEFEYILGRWINFPTDAAPPAPIVKNEKEKKKEKEKENKPSLIGFSTNLVDLQKLVNIFVKQWEESLIKMQDYCHDGEEKEWTEITHKLKGSAALCKAHDLQEMCDRGQRMLNATAEERRNLLAEITAEYEVVKQALLQSIQKN